MTARRRTHVVILVLALVTVLLAVIGTEQSASAQGWDARTYTRAYHPGWPYPAWSVNWDRIAMCESSGRWHINTGNGYYGGLQFSLGTWLWYGGQRFAYYPHNATPYEQKVIAERVLTGWDGHRPAQGIGAWPVCGRYR